MSLKTSARNDRALKFKSTNTEVYMNSRRISGTQVILAVILAWTALAATPAAGPGVPGALTRTVVMSGLDNPRGLAIGPAGAIYVAEAGRGGAGPCVFLAGVAQIRCYGPTGAISRLWRGQQERVLTGLPSHASAAGEANGPNDISVQGLGGTYITIGLGGTPQERAQFGPAGASFGTLVRAPAFGPVRVIADLVQYEADNNPDGGPVDSNVFGLLGDPGARIVTDAGGNSIIGIGANGDLSTLAVLPARASGRPTDAVPTSIVKGPDGAYYIGELSGVPFTAGAARIYRMVPGEAPTIFLTGFKTIIDLAFGPDGGLYVLEHASGPMFFPLPGKIIRVDPDGTRTVVVDGLNRPTSLVVDDDGTIYVTNNGVSVGIGEVLKITF
jgi:DNA-binding beta-propeller fold protein YncE